MATKLLLPAFLTIFTLFTTGCMTPASDNSDITPSGLTTISDDRLDNLAIRPGVDFEQYRKIKIEPLEISYSERKAVDAIHNQPEDFQFDEKELSIFNEKFAKGISKTWQERFGWEQTEGTGPDVLLVRAKITDLYLYSSIKNDKPFRRTSFVNESSTMDIQLTLVDSSSGEVVFDSKGRQKTGRKGSGTDTMQRINSVSYWNDVYQAFRQWASILGKHISPTA